MNDFDFKEFIEQFSSLTADERYERLNDNDFNRRFFGFGRECIKAGEEVISIIYGTDRSMAVFNTAITTSLALVAEENKPSTDELFGFLSRNPMAYKFLTLVFFYTIGLSIKEEIR